MAPRTTPPPKGSASNDTAAYRDLLLFEERLKSNVIVLQRRKSRYQLFLCQLLLLIVFLCAEVFLPSEYSMLVIPYKLMLQHLLPDLYKDATHIALHPYITSGLLLVSMTTLILFFASGLYSEKIAYANKYVPHANKALRSFNMYLNVRKPSLRSQFSLDHLKFFSPRQEDPHQLSSQLHSSSPSRARSRSNSQTPRSISPIPPASNPRGELIFSSRVSKSFTDGYERHRAAFERRREEKERFEKMRGWWGRILFWQKPPLAQHVRTHSLMPSQARGRVSRSGTPPIALTPRRERSGSPAPSKLVPFRSRASTPPPSSPPR